MRSYLAVAALTGGIALVLAASAPGQSSDKDCADFDTQEQAQDYFEENGGSPSNNFDLLDSDGDGIACEDLPSGGGGGGGPAPGPGGNSGATVVVSVADGDTITVQRRGRDVPVRIIGVDAPEDTIEQECGGAASSESLRKLLDIGDRVRLVADSTQDSRDAYGRILRYVELKGRDVGRQQILRGHAAPYVFDDPFKRVGTYRRARDEARRADRGVWGSCDGDFHDPL